MMYKQRDIVLVPFPYSDLSGIKQRPALILSNNRLRGNDVLCCLITSSKPLEGIMIKKADIEEGSLPFKSWIKPHRLFAIHSSIIRKRLCSITPKLHEEAIYSIVQYVK